MQVILTTTTSAHTSVSAHAYGIVATPALLASDSGTTGPKNSVILFGWHVGRKVRIGSYNSEPRIPRGGTPSAEPWRVPSPILLAS